MSLEDRVYPTGLMKLSRPQLFEPLVYLSGYRDLKEMRWDRDGRFMLVKTLVALGITDRDALTETCEWVLGEVYDETVDEILARIDLTAPAFVDEYLPNGKRVTIRSELPSG